MSVLVTAMTAVELADIAITVGAVSTALELVERFAMGESPFGYSGFDVNVTGGPAEEVESTSDPITVASGNNLNATGARISSAVIGAVENGDGKYETAGIIGVDVGSTIAAVAPVLGVSIEGDISQSNPSLWSKLVNAIRPFCYDGNKLMLPMWVGYAAATGQFITSVAKDIVEAINDVFIEEHIGHSDYPAGPGTADGTYSTGMNAVDFLTSLGWEVYDPNNYLDGVSGACACRRLPPWTGPSGWDVAGICGTIDVRDGDFSGPSISANFDSTYPYRLSIRSYGNSVSIRESNVVATSIGYDPSLSYPDGTEQWEGTTYSTIPETNPAVVSVDSTTGTATTQPMVPVSLPSTAPKTAGDSVASNDPVEHPDPTSTYDPGVQVDPNVIPYPVPQVVPYPDVIINPTLNPSLSRDLDIELVQTEALFADNGLPIPTWLNPVPSGLSPVPSMPSTPLPFSSGGGLVTVYHPTQTQLYNFEAWLWVTLSQASVNTVWNNPFDGVIALFELYCTPNDVGTRNIHSGFLDSGVSSSVISRYVEIDCGTLGIPEYYGNYMDYSPYTQAHIYLPFIGVQELNPDDIVGHAVNVTYRIDCYNGSCIAMITVAKVTMVNDEPVEYSNTMYQFSGNCSVELPIAGGSQAAIKAGMMQADAYQRANTASYRASLAGGLASALMGALTGSPGFLTGAVSGFANAMAMPSMNQANYLANMLSGKSTVQKSGGFGSSHGALGIKTPFITITRPKQVIVSNYNELYGYPAHKMVQVGACTGFIRCREVHVISPTATDAEKTQIEQLLKAGVYVTE